MNLGWEDEPWDWEAEDDLETQSTGWGAEDSRPGTPGSWAEDFGVPGEVSSPPQVDWVSRSSSAALQFLGSRFARRRVLGAAWVAWAWRPWSSSARGRRRRARGRF